MNRPKRGGPRVSWNRHTHPPFRHPPLQAKVRVPAVYFWIGWVQGWRAEGMEPATILTRGTLED